MLNGGNETSFWHNLWLGDSPLPESLPRLFEICDQQNLTVKEMIDRGWYMSFRRWLDPAIQGKASALRSSWLAIALGVGKDQPRWKFTENGKCTVKSMYVRLPSSDLARKIFQTPV